MVGKDSLRRTTVGNIMFVVIISENAGEACLKMQQAGAKIIPQRVI